MYIVILLTMDITITIITTITTKTSLLSPQHHRHHPHPHPQQQPHHLPASTHYQTMCSGHFMHTTGISSILQQHHKASQNISNSTQCLFVSCS